MQNRDPYWSLPVNALMIRIFHLVSDKIASMEINKSEMANLEGLRPTFVEINLSRLRDNLQAICKAVKPAKVLVMLKANAYGHGLAGVAPFIEPYTDYIGVALLEEGIRLRQMGIKKPILVAGGTLPEQVPFFIKYNLTLTASSPALLDAAELASSQSDHSLKVHLKIDTGMERVGVHYYETEPFLEKSIQLKHVVVEGIYTHFANSESSDLSDARRQLDRFQEVLGFYDKRQIPVPELRHSANSAAICNLPESYLDMVRPGIMFYGVYPGKDVKCNIRIQPALTWKSRVSYSKITQADQPVSYGSLWKADHPVRIVTIPCGYADGYFRRMTNNAQVMVNGRKFQQVGQICMDQFMVDMEDTEAQVGDEVILLGKSDSGEKIDAEDLAEWTGTNAYEVLTNINERVPRVFVEDTA
jgi:alanine racemase